MHSDESPSEAEPAVEGGLADWLRMDLTAGLRFPPQWLLVTAACIRQAGAVLSAVRGQSEHTALDERRTWCKATGRRQRGAKGPLGGEEES